MISYKQFIAEHVLSIGLNPDHEKYREKHRQEIHDMLHHAYKNIGGYSGKASGSKEESDSIHHDITHSLIKATKREGKLSSVNLYKAQHGRKSIAAATDATPKGKEDFIQGKKEDHHQKRAWAEVSGAVEKISDRLGVPKIPNHMAAKLLGKTVTPSADKYHYTRQIGDHPHEKVMIGHPKIS